MSEKLNGLLKDSAYRLTQFKPELIKKLEKLISVKTSGKTDAYYVTCLVRGKPIKLTPEESIRQLFILYLRHDLGYPFNRMQLEYPVTMGRDIK